MYTSIKRVQYMWYYQWHGTIALDKTYEHSRFGGNWWFSKIHNTLYFIWIIFNPTPKELYILGKECNLTQSFIFYIDFQSSIKKF